MSAWLKATGIGGSIVVLIALVIAFLKQLIAFVGFLTFAIKIIIVLFFITLFLGVGFLVFRTWKESQKRKSND